jgi:hypothetical protein
MHKPSSFGPPDDSRPREPATWRFGRWLDLGMGLLFVVIACVIVGAPDAAPGVGHWIAALVVGGLGVDALLAAARNRRSLLSRVGPLP